MGRPCKYDAVGPGSWAQDLGLFLRSEDEVMSAIENLYSQMVITIPAGVKHWHGAKRDSWFSHIAVEVPGEETSNEWCEPVTDEEYNNL